MTTRSNDPEANVERARRAAHRGYERARVRLGATRGLVVGAVVALAAFPSMGVAALAWGGLPWAVWVALDWRGGALRAGGVRGVMAGVATLVLPMTWLRACCASMMTPGMPMAEAECCARPWMCGAAGAAVGLAVAVTFPRVAAGRRLEAALGLAIGFASVAALRCTVLLAGEALGLLFGVGAGMAAAGAARAWISRAAVRA